MSVYSMTGYGCATCSQDSDGVTGVAGAGSVTVELRSVNGRFLDLALRLPDELRVLEPALRELVASACRRGKVELRASVAGASAGGAALASDDQLAELSQAEAAVRARLPQARPLSVHEALHWCRAQAPAAKVDDAALAAAREALAGLVDARASEGVRLAAVLRDSVGQLRQLAARAEPLVPAAVQRQQQRFVERWNEALASVGAGSAVSTESLQERALSEAAAYAIRIDVAEELARLQSHLAEIERLLERGGAVGKRLDFLIQELHREANTLGSKATALELTAVAVDMKVAIEQMREQVQNLE